MPIHIRLRLNIILLWKTGTLENKLLIELLQNSLAVFVEGEHPTVKDANSFKDLNVSLDELQELTEEIILKEDSKLLHLYLFILAII